MKLTLNKGITATRLNQKTGVPYSESETSIPFGAILTYKGSDRDSEKFNLHERTFPLPTRRPGFGDRWREDSKPG